MPKSSTAIVIPASRKRVRRSRDRVLVDEQCAFGDLDRDALGIDARALDLIEQPLFVIVSRQVLRKQVDRDARGPSAALPKRWRSAAPCAGPAATDVHASPAAARARTAPRRERHDRRSRQRLGADDTARPRLDQRLKQNFDLLLRDRAFQEQVALTGAAGADVPDRDARLPHFDTSVPIPRHDHSRLTFS